MADATLIIYSLSCHVSEILIFRCPVGRASVQLIAQQKQKLRAKLGSL